MKKSLLSILLIFSIIIIKGQSWTITEVASMPEPVSNNAVIEAIVNDTPYLYSFAGIDTSKIYSGIHLKAFRYNTINNQWSTLPPLPDDLGKIAAGASRIDSIIYIIGGYTVFANGNELSSDKVHRFNVNTNSYLSDGAPIPVPIDDHVQAVWKDSLIYVITGWSNTGNVDDVQIYDPENDTWTAGTSVPNTNTFKSFGASGTIIGDTIYYFGGARFAGNFPIQNKVITGIINPDNPAEISWDWSFFDTDVYGYRMAATFIGNRLFWIGGSGVTYNYDGIAYNGSGGVPPLNRIIYYHPEMDFWQEEFYDLIPMDLRGIGNINDTILYIAGGMVENQEVSARTFKLTFQSFPTSTNSPVPLVELIVAPNPVLAHLSFRIPNGTGKGIVEVYSNIGRRVISANFSGEGSMLSLEHLSKGLYWIRVTQNDQFYITRIIKQ